MRADTTWKRLCGAALFTVLAAVAGLLESFVPLELILPLPGVKLGLANIFVAAAFVTLGKGYAFGVLLARTLLIFLFSGNPYALLLSLAGGTLSFVGLLVFVPLVGKVFTYIAVFAACAALHGIGQCLAAYVFIGSPIFAYLPLLGIACTLTGALCGLLMNVFAESPFFPKGKTANEA